jgi:hypothetical protein
MSVTFCNILTFDHGAASAAFLLPEVGEEAC